MFIFLQIHPTQVRSTKISAFEVRSVAAQLRQMKANLAEIRHHPRMFLPPAIPLLNPLFQDFEMFRIRHLPRDLDCFWSGTDNLNWGEY